MERREFELGDSNNLFVVVFNGLNENEEVVFNLIVYVNEVCKEVF